MNAIAYEKVSLTEARNAYEESPVHKAVAKASPFGKALTDVASAIIDAPRGAGPRQEWAASEPLHEATAAWMSTLPAANRPLVLAHRFPRIANRICELWRQPVRCSEYLAELLIVRKGSRQGFPVPVATDIYRLSAYYATLHPYQPSSPTLI